MLSLFLDPSPERQRETGGMGEGVEWGRGGLLRPHFLPLARAFHLDDSIQSMEHLLNCRPGLCRLRCIKI